MTPTPTPPVQRYLFQRSVESAEGSQTCYVDAETLVDAERILRETGGDLYCEEVNVSSLGDPEFVGTTTVDDFGDFEVAPGGLPLPQACAGTEPIAPADDYHEWQSAVFTLMGHASGLYAEGKHDMPAWCYGLAEKIARAHVDDAHAMRVREVATKEAAKYTSQVDRGESSSKGESSSEGGESNG